MAQHSSLIREEGKGFVFADRATEDTAKLVALQAVLRRGKVIAAIQNAVSQKLKRRTVELVSTTFCHHIHHTTTKARKLGAECARIQTEFLDCIRIGKHIGDLRQRIFI